MTILTNFAAGEQPFDWIRGREAARHILNLLETRDYTHRDIRFSTDPDGVPRLWFVIDNDEAENPGHRHWAYSVSESDLFEWFKDRLRKEAEQDGN